MEDEKIEGEEGETLSSEEDKKNEIPPETPKNPVERELDKIEGKKVKRTELEKAIHSRRKIDERIAELKKESGEEIVEEDDTPLTVGMLKKLEAEKATKTALQMTEEIKDDKERELIKYYLRESIVPSGNAEADFKLALSVVNSLKNAQIAEEAQRKADAQKHSSGSGVPEKIDETFEPTAEEKAFMSPPFNLTKEDIIKARQAKG